MLKLIRNWDELEGLESEDGKYYICITPNCGWIYSKETGERQVYLSTHTFYGQTHKGYTLILLEYGFDILLDNWDDKYPEDVDIKKEILDILKEKFANVSNYSYTKNCIIHKNSKISRSKELADYIVKLNKIISKYDPDGAYNYTIPEEFIHHEENILAEIISSTYDKYHGKMRKADPEDINRYLVSKSQPRNSLCQCGSGKKFKKCCGKL